MRWIMDKYNVKYDRQLYFSFKANDSSELLCGTRRLENCVTDVKEWLPDNSLKLNREKIEFIVFTSGYYHRFMHTNPQIITVISAIIKASIVLRNLGVHMDSILTMQEHIKKVAKAMHFYIRMKKRVSHNLDQNARVRAVGALVLSRFDYANMQCHSSWMYMSQSAHAASSSNSCSHADSSPTRHVWSLLGLDLRYILSTGSQWYNVWRLNHYV